ncbi:hypothetical protein [Candidatus Synchoanobacter obligatus]|uniref:Outer membrane protein beta-barrel domain-containing protein n=1 Tax=Candidatus Synchoanobacter obligatus TaxID=2919597 RepID=A0ABT1L701_9GAMM|nr:hypothetical protein [Candidatus Synchoanobacter obligatus]MCP8352576.1 hypothetical protein [Candidatus Synchoanobacter obligatus]
MRRILLGLCVTGAQAVDVGLLSGRGLDTGQIIYGFSLQKDHQLISLPCAIEFKATLVGDLSGWQVGTSARFAYSLNDTVEVLIGPTFSLDFETHSDDSKDIAGISTGIQYLVDQCKLQLNIDPMTRSAHAAAVVALV